MSLRDAIKDAWKNYGIARYSSGPAVTQQSNYYRNDIGLRSVGDSDRPVMLQYDLVSIVLQNQGHIRSLDVPDPTKSRQARMDVIHKTNGGQLLNGSMGTTLATRLFQKAQSS